MMMKLLLPLVALAAMSTAGRTQDFQVRMPITCSSNLCLAHLLKVPSGRAFRARHVSCLLQIAVPSGRTAEINSSGLWIVDAGGTTRVAEFMPLTRLGSLRNAFTLSTNESYAGNESIVLTAGAGLMVKAFIEISTDFSPLGECSVSGTLTP